MPGANPGPRQTPSGEKENMKIKVERKSNELTDTVFVASVEGTGILRVSNINKYEAAGELILSEDFQSFSKLRRVSIEIEDLTN